MVTRKAVVAPMSSSVESYLPDNYRVVGWLADHDGREAMLIEGRDVAGWTLDDYVIPRLASGLYSCREVTLNVTA